MTDLKIVDHLTGQTASGIDYDAIEDAVRGWREPWGLSWEGLNGVEIVSSAA